MTIVARRDGERQRGVALYVEGLREDGEPLDSAVIRRARSGAGAAEEALFSVGAGEEHRFGLRAGLLPHPYRRTMPLGRDIGPDAARRAP
jgi:hypothetical protein